MSPMLTKAAARELGRILRLIRHVKELTLREAAAKSHLSVAYIENIERGERLGVRIESLERLGDGYGMDRQMMVDLVLQARVMSTLEEYGLSDDECAFLWRGLVGRLEEIEHAPHVDVGGIVASVGGFAS